MKIKKIITLTLAFILAFTFISSAGGWTQNIAVEFNRINIEIDGDKVNADNILYNGTTYIPLRAASNMLGFDVDWNERTDTASLTSNPFAKTIDLPEAYKYFEEINQFTTVSMLFSNILKSANGKIYNFDFLYERASDGTTIFDMLESLDESSTELYYDIMENKAKLYELYQFDNILDYSTFDSMYEYIGDSHSAISSIFQSIKSFDRGNDPTISNAEIINFLPSLDSTNVLIASFRMLNYNALTLENTDKTEIKLYY